MLFFSPFEFLSVALLAIALGVALQIGIGQYGASFSVSFACFKGDDDNDDGPEVPDIV